MAKPPTWGAFQPSNLLHRTASHGKLSVALLDELDDVLLLASIEPTCKA